MSFDDRDRDAMVGRGQVDNYASAADLSRRQALFQFPDLDRSSGDPLLERIRWTGTEQVLDAGCGNGLWIAALRDRLAHPVIGLDLSAGMLADASMALGEGQPLTVGDIQHLPFPPLSFDVVLCLWMLYHVADLGAALAECRRVLRPGERLLATANVTVDQPPFAVLLRRALEAATGQVRDRWLPRPGFRAENAAGVLRSLFPRVEAQRHVAAFSVPSPEPVLEAMRSVRVPIEIFIGQPVDWPEVESAARRMIEHVIARDGAFRTANTSVSFLAWR